MDNRMKQKLDHYLTTPPEESAESTFVYFVEYDHYEDHDVLSCWFSEQKAKEDLARRIEQRRSELNGMPFWDEHCYLVQEYEVTA